MTKEAREASQASVVAETYNTRHVKTPSQRKKAVPYPLPEQVGDNKIVIIHLY